MLALGLSLHATAQNTDDDFQKFRQQMLSDYNGFRQSVLDGYADFLDTVWQDFQAFKGVKRDDTPKPRTAPDIQTKPMKEPTEDNPVVETPQKQPKAPTSPKPSPQPVVPQTPPQPLTSPQVPFQFYGMTLKAPELQCMVAEGVTSKAVAAVWKKYEQAGAKKEAQSLLANAQALGLNDWFTYEMVRCCVDQQMGDHTANDRMLLKHFLLVNMGYDARLALHGNEFLLLLNMEEQLYSRAFANIDGTRYFLFTDNDDSNGNVGAFSTCSLPSDRDHGKAFEMLIQGGMKLDSGNTRTTELVYGDIAVSCEVDVALMEMVRHYPQMDIPMYASSTLNPTLRQSLLDQLRPHVAGLSKQDAANKLLHFVQYCFDYAKDDEQHGYEKAYFLEENFYYPRNDCEDRAIFYAYLVRNLLGLDVHLIQFPGHECTAVHFNDSSVKGDGYVFEGQEYIICDPTYIGASVGRCMPDYQMEKPKVQKW